MAIPALQELAAQGALTAVVIPDTNGELMQEVGYLLQGTNIPVRSLKKETNDEETICWLKDRQAGFIFMMTFPWKIRAALIRAFDNRFYNFHYGLLPGMRGADPVFESIRQQLPETGITVHAVTEAIDKGPILAMQKVPLNDSMTHGWLCTSLGMAAAQFCRALTGLLATQPQPPLQPQPESGGHYYPRPELKDVMIDWENMDSSRIQALVRACNPWNKGAYTQCRGWNFRVLSVSRAGNVSGENIAPGTIMELDKTKGVLIACRDNQLLKLDIFYCDMGFFDGPALSGFGLKKGDRLQNPV